MVNPRLKIPATPVNARVAYVQLLAPLHMHSMPLFLSFCVDLRSTRSLLGLTANHGPLMHP